jgi:serine/threonine protein kinase
VDQEETLAVEAYPAMSSLQTVGNYELLDKIADGGMGTIYRGRDRTTGQLVAVKILPAPMAANPILLKRFEQEFKVASRLDHPNIVRALAFGEAGNLPYMVMELVDGESLGQRLEREGRLTSEEAIRIIAQVAQGLHRAHKMGLIHRDVKPDNILVTRDGVAKLADLGLVKEQDTDLNLTRTGRGLGTPHFMAPEQFRNAKAADARCDIYSLGATLYQMVTGELPFKSTGPLDAWMKKIHNELIAPRQLVPTLSERVDWAILRAMDADPSRRPATCREFIEDLTGHSTRKMPVAVATQANTELWYLVYRDDQGEQHTVKGSATAIRRSLKEGLLGDASNIRAARSKQGPFEPLRLYPEFRDLVVLSSPPPLPQQQPQLVGNSTTHPPYRDSTVAGRRSTGEDTPPGSEQELSGPHIFLGPEEDGEGEMSEWFKWVALLFLAIVGGAAATYYLLPLLR